jgi:hypothetical protein
MNEKWKMAQSFPFAKEAQQLFNYINAKIQGENFSVFQNWI